MQYNSLVERIEPWISFYFQNLLKFSSKIILNFHRIQISINPQNMREILEISNLIP